jgi:hypothetical protein
MFVSLNYIAVIGKQTVHPFVSGSNLELTHSKTSSITRNESKFTHGDSALQRHFWSKQTLEFLSTGHPKGILKN